MKPTFVAKNKTKDLCGTIALILAVLTVLSVMTITAMPASEATATSGNCGDGLTWTITENTDNPDTYTLTITGEKKMTDYHHTDPSYEGDDVEPPWIEYASKITKIDLPDGLTRIGSYAFYGTAITEIDIPDTVKYIGASAFWFCTSLKSVSIPSSVLDIETGAFGTCRALTEVTFEDSAKVRSIDASAFEATNIKTLDLSGLSSLTEIGAGAFQRNGSLESVSIPAKVETVGFEAFNSCSALSTITVPDGSMLVSLGEKAFNDTALVSVDLSNATRLSSIGESAFGSCESLTTVTLADNFGGDATGAFTGSTSLTSVMVGSSNVPIDGNGGFTIPVASIGDIGYASLLEAVNAAIDGQTITITKGDVYEASKVVVEGKNIIIDLNGKTFTSIEGITVSKEATLTIKDSVGNGNLIGEYNPLIQVNGTFNLESGLLTGENSMTVKISGTFNMSGGEVNGDTAKGTYAIYFGSGTATITGGRVVGTSGDSALNCNSSNLTIGIPGSTEGPYISAIRPSGTFTFHSGEIGEVRASNITSIGVMDGVFGTDITNRLPAGYYCTLGSDGKYHVTQLTEKNAAAKIGETLYATLNGAGSAVKDGETITVLRGYEGEDTFRIMAYNVTVDLNGFTITVTTEGAYGVSINPEYGTDYDDTKPNQALVKNGTIVADIPLYAASGGSMYVNIVTEDLVLTSASDCPDLVLGQEAYMTYTGGDIEVAGYLAEASDGTQYVYGTVAAAMDVDADKSVKLLYDSTETIVMNEAGNWTVDLNGYTVDASGDCIQVQVQGAHLTVTNGDVNASGIGAIIWDVSTTNVDIDASITLKDVDLAAQGGFGAYAHGSNKGSDITVIGGSISAPNGTGIYFPSTGIVSLDDCSISGLTGIEMRAGTLEIGGDTIVKSLADKYSVGETPESGGSTVTGAAIAIAPYSNSTTGGTISVTIEDGTFEGPVSFAQTHISDVSDVPEFKFSISGGSFTSTGKDANGDTYPAVVTEEGEVTGKFISGGSFSDDSVLTYVVDGKGLIENGTMFDVTNMYTITYTFNEKEYTEEVPEGFAPSTDVLPELPAGCGYDFGTWDATAAVTEDTSVTVKAEITELSVTISVSVEDGTTTLRAVVESSASGETTYAWSNDEDKETITVTESGEYTVKVTLTTTSGEISVSGKATAKTTYTATENGGSSTTTENSDGSTTETVVEEDGSLSETTEKIETTASGNTVTTVITTGKDSSGKEIESTASATIDATQSQTGDIVNIPVEDVTVAVESIKSADNKTVSISIGNNDKVTIAPEAMEAISSSEAKLEISNNTAKIVADKTVANTLASDQSVSISVSSAEHTDLNDTQQQSVPENSTIIELSATVGSDPIHELGGTVEVRMNYDLPEGIDADDVIVFYVDDEGVLHDMVTKFADNIITFFTNHFSYYFVGDRSMIVHEDPEPSPGEDDTPVVVPPVDDDDDYVPLPPAIVEEPGSSDDDTVKIVACAAAAVVAALMAAFLIIIRRD